MDRHELASYIAASYPYLAIETTEEERAMALLKEAATQAGRAVVPLSVAASKRAHQGVSVHSILGDLRARQDPAVFAAVDLHDHLGDPEAVRSLRELRALLERRGQTLVFVGPAIAVPAALAPDVVRFALPLPSPEELARVLAEEVAAAGIQVTPQTAQRAVRAAQGMTASGARRAFRRAARDPQGLAAGEVRELGREKRRMLHQGDLLEFVDAPPSLQEVGGLGLLKTWLVEREAAFEERARAFGLPVPKGLLLVGVQGCGKSLVAKSVASLWGLPLARLEFSALFTYGSSPEQNMRRIFRLAEALSPVVLWLDEIDKAFGGVASASGSSESLARVFGAFITWMQEKTAPVFVVATANAVDHLPGELLRKGRFDEIFFVDLPNQDERRRILEIHLRAHGRDPASFAVDKLAAQAEHFSGAELEQVVVAGLYRAFQKNRPLNDEDLRRAIEGTVPLYRTAEEQIKGLRDWAKRRARRASEDARLVELWTQAKRGDRPPS